MRTHWPVSQGIESFVPPCGTLLLLLRLLCRLQVLQGGLEAGGPEQLRHVVDGDGTLQAGYQIRISDQWVPPAAPDREGGPRTCLGAVVIRFETDVQRAAQLAAVAPCCSTQHGQHDDLVAAGWH